MSWLGELATTLMDKRQKALEAKAQTTGKPQQGGMLDSIYKGRKDQEKANDVEAGAVRG